MKRFSRRPISKRGSLRHFKSKRRQHSLNAPRITRGGFRL